MAKIEIAGLYLYRVQIRWKERHDWTKQIGLFITTKSRSHKIALRKAETVLRNRSDEFPKATIEGFEYQGTLDA